MLTYFDFFQRGTASSSDWDNPIGRPRAEDTRTGKLGQLHHDVFNHHHQPESIPEFVKELIVQNTDGSRIIALDNITDYYLNSSIIVDSPLIESLYIDNPTDSEIDDHKCTFEEFFHAVIDIPFRPASVRHGLLGGNRLVYLFGNVGSGKSFLCARLIARILKEKVDTNNFTVVPIRICFESLFRADLFDIREISKGFFLYLLSEIERQTHRFHEGEIKDADRAGLESEHQVFALIGRYVLELAKRQIRLVFIFDNIDGFHYKYSRYLFFREKYNEFIKSLNKTIIRLCNVMSDEHLLGNIGLCVLVVARENVAKDCLLNGADPDRTNFGDHRAFWLQEIEPKAIIQSRFQLLDHATKAIVNSGHSFDGSKGVNYLDALSVARERILNSASNSSEGLGVIWSLCHHGHRSLIDFLSQVKVNYYSQREIHERLFGPNPHILERLYITNMRRRYAQSKKHFPNLFLCDIWVNPENIENKIQAEHYHTYWLKYMILKFILVNARVRKSVTAKDIIENFVKKFGYEDNLTRICLGSLCMANESRCLELGGSPELGPMNRPLLLTTRGSALIDNRYIKGKKVEYCFDISYLQLVTDDYWLALPKTAVDDIFVDVNLAYTYEKGSRYYSGVSKYLSKKIFVAFRFVRLLEEAWRYEGIKCKEGAGSIDFLKPDFDLIYQSLLEVVSGIIKSFSGVIRDGSVSITAQDVSNFVRDLRADDSYARFFDEVWKVRVKLDRATKEDDE